MRGLQECGEFLLKKSGAITLCMCDLQMVYKHELLYS
jgi:hypothetical protein